MNKIRAVINSLINEFIYGGHILSLGGSSIAYTTSILLNIKITWDFLLIIYFGLQAIYLYDRYADIKQDNLTNVKRTKYFSNYVKKIPFIILFFLVIFWLILLRSDNIKALIFGSTLIVSSLFYSIFLKKMTKKIFAFKNFFVAICWASITIFLAIYYFYPIDKALILIFLFVFMVLFINVSFCDIKDFTSDKEKKLLTPVVIFGNEKLLKILRVFIFISGMPLLYGVYNNLLPRFALLLLFVIPYTFYYFNKSMEEKVDLGYLTNTLVYGEYILWSISVYIGKILL